jgi:hypothetical protein
VPTQSSLLPEEKRQLEARIATLERQNKELKAKLVELETAHRPKTKATIATMESKSNNLKVKQHASSQKVQVIAAVIAEYWDHDTFRREQLNDHDVGQCPEWKDTADCNHLQKLMGPMELPSSERWCTRALLGNGPWEDKDSPNSPSPELHGGHLHINKTRQIQTVALWLHQRSDVESWCQQCDTCAASQDPQTRSWGLMQQYNVGDTI